MELIENKYFRYILFVVSLLYSLSFVSWNYVEDDYYFYNRFNTYYDQPMGILTCFIGYLWTNFVSINILSVKFLGWLICIFSTILIYCSFVNKKDYTRNLDFLSIGIILMGNWSWSEYSPDAMSLLFMCLLTCIICRTESYNYNEILCLALISALITASRFPNILIIPVIVLTIIFKGVLCYIKWKRIIFNSILYTFVTLLLYYFILSILIGRIDLYTWLQEYIMQPKVSGKEDHSLALLINYYRTDLWWGLRDLSMVIGAISMACCLGLTYHRSKIANLIGLTPFCYLLYKSWEKLQEKVFGWKTLYGFSIIFVLLVNATKNKSIKYWINTLFVICAGLIMAAGSNTGLGKCSLYFAAVTPVVLIEYSKHTKLTFFSKCIVLVYVIYSFAYHFAIFKSKNLDDYINYDRVTLFISTEWKKQLEYRLEDVKKYGVDGHNIYYGTPGHRIQTITNTPFLFPSVCAQDDNDSLQIDWVIKTFKADKHCVVFDYTNSSYMKQEMEQAGAICVKMSELGSIYKNKK